MQSELSTLREFAKASAEGDEIGPCNRGGELHSRLGDVVYPVSVQAENVRFYIGGEELEEVFSEIIGEFCKECF